MGLYDGLALDDQSRDLLKQMGDQPAERLSKLEILRTWIVSHNYISCRTDDKFLLRFLRVSKFSCEAAKARIEKWCVMRTSKLDGLPELFNDHNPKNQKLREMVELGIFYVLPKPDNLGRAVMVVDLEKMMGSKLEDQEIMMRASYMVMDHAIFSLDRLQVNGLCIIEIGSMHFDMSLISYWTPDKMKKSIELWQGCNPCRFKQAEYFNMPSALKVLIEGMLRIMKPKMRERISFHSDNKLPENIPEHCMPSKLGGTAPEWEDIKEDFMRELDAFVPEFELLKTCKVDDNKRPKVIEEGDSWGISGTYRPIATDQ